MDDALELEIRKKIFDLLKKNPGLNLSTIAELLEISVALAVYHLDYLEKNGILIVSRETGFKRYYTKGQLGTEIKRTLSILRQETPLRIVLFLLRHPYSNHKEILTLFDLAPSTLSYHLKKLIDNQIIAEQTFGEKQGYIVLNEKEIVHLLIRYKPSKILKQFKDTWTDFGVAQAKSQEKKSTDTEEDK